METGWHPDPTGAHELRYHDGRWWTAQVRDAGVETTSAMPKQQTKRTPPWALFFVLAGVAAMLAFVAYENAHQDLQPSISDAIQYNAEGPDYWDVDQVLRESPLTLLLLATAIALAITGLVLMTKRGTSSNENPSP